MTRLASWQDFGTHDESAYPELWRGCVGAWAPCLGPTGLRLHDLSRYRNWGTLTNMDAATDWVVSGGRYALDFDRVDDWVPTTAPGVVTINRSVSIWFRSSVSLTNGQYATLIRWGTATTFPADIGKDFQVLFGTDANLGTNGLGMSQYGDAIGVTGLNDGRWHHGYFEARGSIYSIYIDGVFRTSKTMTTNAESGTIRLGAYLAGTLLYSGELDDILVYNRTLSFAEIRLLATRRGIAFERRKRRSVYFDAAFFNSAWARNSNVILSPVGAA